MSSPLSESGKHRSLSLKQKLGIIDDVKNNEDSRKNISQKFNISASTLSEVIKRSDELRGKASINPLLLNVKKLKKPKYER
jgi:CENP-B N-terminal DNA-binding domain